jgi:homoserine/homoserine lactone efflux protein
MEKLVLFWMVSLVSTATPGPAVLYVTSRGMAGGARPALLASLGVLSADAVYILLSITGLSTVLIASFELFTLIKWVGVVYLVYLGVRLLLNGLTASSPTPAETPVAARPRAFVGGFLLHAANPKALLYFGSLVPQFVDPARPLFRQLAALTAIHLVTASVVLLAYSLLSARFRRTGAGRRVRRAFSVASGSLLIGGGISLAFAGKGD